MASDLQTYPSVTAHSLKPCGCFLAFITFFVVAGGAGCSASGAVCVGCSASGCIGCSASGVGCVGCSASGCVGCSASNHFTKIEASLTASSGTLLNIAKHIISELCLLFLYELWLGNPSLSSLSSPSYLPYLSCVSWLLGLPSLSMHAPYPGPCWPVRCCAMSPSRNISKPWHLPAPWPLTHP